jgi:chromate reductase, NAD(P)H dehydrogenase (quinone)
MIGIIVGTNRKNSNSSYIAQFYKNILEEKGVISEIIDLSTLPEDFIFTALYENVGKDDRFNLFSQKMKSFPKFIFIVPEYNHSFPGVLKAFIDGMDYPSPFTDKKCALIGLSSGFSGAGLALSHLTDIFNYLGMNVLALKPKLAKIESAMDGETLKNPLYIQLIKEQADKLVSF